MALHSLVSSSVYYPQEQVALLFRICSSILYTAANI